MRRIPLALALAPALSISAAAACMKRDSGPPEARAAKPAPAGQTAEPNVGDAPSSFRPPSDGRLTTGSVERYIAVQKRAAELAAGVRLEDGRPPTEAVAQLATADLRAAKELGHDPGEYRWVREKVAEALGGPADGMNVDGVLKSLTDATVESLEARRAESTDPAERARLAEEIARMKPSPDPAAAAKPAQNASALAHNRKLLEPYRAQLSPPQGPAPGQLPKVAIDPKPTAP